MIEEREHHGVTGKHVITARAYALDGQTLEEEDFKPAHEDRAGRIVLLEREKRTDASSEPACTYGRYTFEMRTGHLEAEERRRIALLSVTRQYLRVIQMIDGGRPLTLSRDVI